MQIKFLLTLILGFSLVGCSPSSDTSTSSPISETTASESYSPQKQNYMKSCVETSEESFCSCQFDVIDPILSQSIGNDWANKSMQEKDFETYISAVETALRECG